MLFQCLSILLEVASCALFFSITLLFSCRLLFISLSVLVLPTVCKRWKHLLATDPICFQYVDLSMFPLLDSTILSTQLTKFQHTFSLKLDHASITDDFLIQIAQVAKDLQRLSVQDCDGLTDQAIKNWMIESSQKLRLLDLSNCSGLTDACLNFLSLGCPYLTTLILSGLKISDQGLRFLASSFQAFVTLDLSYTRVTGTGVFLSIFSGCPTLQSLSLAGCTEFDIIPSAVVHAFQATQEEEKDGPKALTSQEREGSSVALLPVACDELADVNFSRCSKLSSAGLFFFLKHFSQLRSIKLSDCPLLNETALAELLRQENLQEVDVARCPLLTDAGFTSDSPSSSSSHLVHVNLSSLRLISDTGVIALISQHYNTLVSLRLSGCVQIADRSLLALSSSSSCCRHLSLLSVSFCSGVTDQGLSALASLPALTSLCCFYTNYKSWDSHIISLRPIRSFSHFI